MSKTSLFATSLLPAVVAGFLAYLLAMAFMNHFESMATMVQVFAGLTLLAAALVVFMPLGILIFGSKGQPKADKDRKEPAAAAAVADDEALLDEELEPAETEAFADDSEFGSGDEDVFVEGEASEFDDFEMDDFPEDEGKVK